MEKFADTTDAPAPASSKRLVVAGGVAANQHLKHALEDAAHRAGFTLSVPPPALCTDNGAMIAWADAERYHAGCAGDADLDAPARARWPLSEKIF